MDGIREGRQVMRDVWSTRLINPAGADVLDRPAASLLHKAGSGKGENAAALREAAKEFEALFLSYMLNVMRESIEDSGLTENGLGRDIYTELFDQELARSMAGRGALGIADLLMRKLSDPPPAATPDSQPSSLPTALFPPGPDAEKNDDQEVPDFRMPVHAHLSSAFGIRKDPFTHENRFHRGVDLAAPSGMAVRAACAGRVVFSGYQKGYGNTVVVQHPGGFETRYAHLGTLEVKTGDALQLEQVLGTVGSTGRSTGPHLHFEVSRHGIKLDPAALTAD
jgi:murein DD-endopeptidase MepM/ murein hydrolase activator NlpD